MTPIDIQAYRGVHATVSLPIAVAPAPQSALVVLCTIILPPFAQEGVKLATRPVSASLDGFLPPLLALSAIFQIILPPSESVADVLPHRRVEWVNVRIMWRLSLNWRREKRVEVLSSL